MHIFYVKSRNRVENTSVILSLRFSQLEPCSLWFVVKYFLRMKRAFFCMVKYKIDSIWKWKNTKFLFSCIDFSSTSLIYIDLNSTLSIENTFFFTPITFWENTLLQPFPRFHRDYGRFHFRVDLWTHNFLEKLTFKVMLELHFAGTACAWNWGIDGFLKVPLNERGGGGSNKRGPFFDKHLL